MTSAEDLKNFRPKFPLFVGVDYDGTLFDSMSVKHLDAFIPAFLETWDVSARENELRKTWERINLYSKDRGINRYAGLLKCFEEMAALTPLPDYSSLREFVNSGRPLSGGGLKEFTAESPSAFLAQVLNWSEKSDRLFKAGMEGRPPFENSGAALMKISAGADVMVISSASSESILRDLDGCGLLPLLSLVSGQEAGSKANQLRLAAAGKYERQNILMIGDSPGDKEAADAVGGLFFPIVPKQENKSWLRLVEEGFDKFAEGSYAGTYTEEVVKEFEEALEL